MDMKARRKAKRLARDQRDRHDMEMWERLLAEAERHPNTQMWDDVGAHDEESPDKGEELLP